jgi:hypothetical protein
MGPATALIMMNQAKPAPRVGFLEYSSTSSFSSLSSEMASPLNTSATNICTKLSSSSATVLRHQTQRVESTACPLAPQPPIRLAHLFVCGLFFIVCVWKSAIYD